MTNAICLNDKYSTTKLVTQEKPEIANSAEDKFESVLFLPEEEGRKGEGGLRTRGYFKAPYEDKPVVSIVTVVYNCEKHIEETIQSVINQTYDNVEYIIIDGGSTDGTLNIIKKYEDALDYWVSEKDGGIYDAMNKGIILSSGGIIGLVNADDYIYKNTLNKVAQAVLSTNCKYTYGNIDLINKDGEVFAKRYAMSKKDTETKKYEEMPCSHPTMFVSMKVYKQIGLFDTRFKLSADYDFLLKVLEHNFAGSRLKITTGAFRMGGKSGGLKGLYENLEVLKYRDISKVKVYKNFLVESLKVSFVKILPVSAVNFLRRFEKKSRNEFY